MFGFILLLRPDFHKVFLRSSL